ncbi:MAG: hypothetical protein JJT78_02315 [Leptospira sp.]|nr:hypothetical protein [Leptospira sp.]
MNEFETKIALSLLFAGVILAFLFLAKPKPSQSKDPQKSGLWGKLFRLLFPPTPPISKTDFNRGLHSPHSKNSSTGSSGAKTPKAIDEKVMEVFDYNGVRILHEDGLWTVNDGGVRVFKDWSDVPPKYQKMVKELDNRSLGNQKKPDYFLEILNGFYYVSMPGGKKKKYNKFTDIPEDIRKFLGK